jgi:predicted DNA-binding transcriptional regulator YafY
MREQFKLHIAYRDPTGAETQRIIWPIMLSFIDAKRFVAGWCELRQDFRTFQTDRIERIELLEERYPGRRRALAKRWRAQVAEETARSSSVAKPVGQYLSTRSEVGSRRGKSLAGAQ